jgi:hypothetical protein
VSTTERLLRLYPARYRTAHGEEIAAVFAEATEGLSGRALRREHAALAAHALRLRTRTGSADPGGRALAGAAPFALAGLAGLTLLLMLALAQTLLSSLTGRAGTDVTGAVFQGLDAVPTLAAMACALSGRWTPARVLLLFTAVEKLAAFAVVTHLRHYLPGNPNVWLGSGVLFATLALVAPPDLAALAFTTPRNRLALGLASACSAAPIVLVNVLLLDNNGLRAAVYLEPAWPLLFPAAGALAALLGRPADRARAAGAGLVVVPWVAVFVFPNPTLPSVLATAAAACAPLAGAFVIAAVVRRRRRSALAPPLDPL